MARTKETYIIIDIEADGPSVLLNSMISIGAVAINDINSEFNPHYYANINPLYGHTQDPKTMEWWVQKEPTAYKQTLTDRQDATIIIPEFVHWVTTYSKYKPVAVAYPAGFDFSFLFAYLETYSKINPFGFTCIDMKTLAMSILGVSFSDTRKNRMPKNWFDPKFPHSHNALDDAIETAFIFKQMLETSQARALTHSQYWTTILLGHLENCGYKIPEKELHNIRKALIKD
jgi:DNA polymerase III alpha subunit (gram-positive type)